MPAPLEITVTNAGRAAIVNAQNTGTAPVTIAQVGLSGTAVTPLPAATTLAGEFKRLNSIAGEVVADDTIHVTLTDGSGDAYTLRSVGLYLADGTLFAIYGQATAIIEKTAQSIAALAIDVIFADIAAASLAFGNANFTNPPATTERQGVIELSTLAEAQAGIDALRALTPATAKAAILGWLLAQDGAGCGLDADLLDGQQGSYYSDIVGRLGYSPLNRGGDTLAGTLSAPTAENPSIAARPNSSTRLEISGNGIGPALMTLHRPGSFAAFLGLDTDNKLKFGGWSLGAVAYELWHSGNDGSGSGVDADLLDGQQGSYYADIVGRLGYSPLNAASYTAADVKAKLLTVDGSGSGVDADLVDGWHRDDIRHWNNLLGKPWNWSGQPGQPSWLWGGNADGAFYVYNPSNFSVAYAASAGNADTVDGYHASQFFGPHNDGSGSGVDADLLDGYQGSSYDRIVAENLVENGGYVIFASGRKECWGVINIVAEDAYTTVNLPVQHDSWVNPIGSGMALSSSANENTAVRDIQYDGSGRPISFRIYNAAGTGGGFPFRWRSVGR